MHFFHLFWDLFPDKTCKGCVIPFALKDKGGSVFFISVFCKLLHVGYISFVVKSRLFIVILPAFRH